jgi:hypothetical protein
MIKSMFDFRLNILEDLLIAKFNHQGNINDYAMEYIASELFDKSEITKQIKDKIITIINKIEGNFNDTKRDSILCNDH